MKNILLLILCAWSFGQDLPRDEEFAGYWDAPAARQDIEVFEGQDIVITVYVYDSGADDATLLNLTDYKANITGTRTELKAGESPNGFSKDLETIPNPSNGAVIFALDGNDLSVPGRYKYAATITRISTDKRAPVLAGIINVEDDPGVVPDTFVPVESLYVVADIGTFLLGSNNLSDVDSAATSRTNIGAQAQHSTLDTIAGFTLSAGNLWVEGAGSLAQLVPGTDGQVLKLVSGTPAWSAPSLDLTGVSNGSILWDSSNSVAGMWRTTDGINLVTQAATHEAAGADERLLDLSYDVNKATGTSVGLRILQTRTQSPSSNYLAWAGRSGSPDVPLWTLNNDGRFHIGLDSGTGQSGLFRVAGIIDETTAVFKAAPGQSTSAVLEIQNSSGDVTTGINASGRIDFTELRQVDLEYAFFTTGAALSSDYTWNWSNNASNYSATKDIGLARLSAGVLGVTDGSSGKGSIDSQSITFTGTINAITASELSQLSGVTDSIADLFTYFDDHLNATNPHGLDKSSVGLGSVLNIKDKVDATIDPDADNDIDEGYSPRSLWVNVTSGDSYICSDNTDGAAVWTQIDSQGVTDHGLIGGLGDDDHPHYVLADGSRSFTGDITLPGTGALRFGDGNTYIKQTSEDTLKFSFNNNEKLVFNSSGISMVSGSSGAPFIAHSFGVGYSFNGDTDTGMQWNSANNFSLMTGNTAALTFDSSQAAAFTGDVGLGVGQNLILDDDDDSYFSSPYDDSIELYLGGSRRWYFDGSEIGAGSGAGAGISGSTATDTNPTIRMRRNDSNTGWGGVTADTIVGITGGVEAFRIDASQDAAFSNDVNVGGYLTTAGATPTSSAHTLRGNVRFERTDASLGFEWNSSAAVFDFNPNMGTSPDFRIRGDNDIYVLQADVSADAVGFGTGTPSARVDIVGTSDKTQLRVQAHSTQTSPLIRVQTSTGVDLKSISGGTTQTTNDTQTVADTLTLADDTTVVVTWTVLGRSGANSVAYIRRALIERDSAGSAAVVGSVESILTNEGDLDCDATITVSGNDARVEVTGVAATTINWSATREYQTVVKP